jgi:hypothetical protein
MADTPIAMVPVNLPADLVAKIEQLKHDREEEQNQSVEQIVQRLCQEYVAVREMSRREIERMDGINRSYEEHPSDYDDADVWEAEWRRVQEGPK